MKKKRIGLSKIEGGKSIVLSENNPHSNNIFLILTKIFNYTVSNQRKLNIVLIKKDKIFIRNYIASYNKKKLIETIPRLELKLIKIKLMKNS
mmetsp:Transcript_4468/g.10523  ORF Transcript_4468/g.10523 Transcript_4468/m.10523 type:complete len:92 (+) Transcript_4468:290-565(+)